MLILVLNSGSSSLKLQLIASKNWKCLYKGHIDGIGLKSCKYKWQTINNPGQIKTKAKTHSQAFKIGIDHLLQSQTIKSLNQIKAIGHRVVHGGEKYFKPTRITPQVIKKIKKLEELAPLHNPPNLEGILASRKLLPKTPDIAIFDTGFHHTIPEKAFLYALPYKWYKKYKIRRYGFHGTSHKYVSQQALKHLKKAKNIITCHLGNGSSITAIKNGKSIDTSMGFTPLEGVPMGTRTGDFDPAVIYYLTDQKRLKLAEIEEILTHSSGLLGLSEISSDVRKLRDAWFKEKNKKAKRALDVFCYRIAKYIASYTATLGGLDALVFTAGIGENAWYVRKWICDYFPEIKLNHAKNKKTDLSNPKIPKTTHEISTKESKVKVLVIPTNEELQIAKEVYKMI